jgi:hypothetical protein
MLERFWTFAQEKVATLRCLTDPARSVRPVAVLEAPAEPPPLSIEERWTRATGAVTAAISGLGRIQSLQVAAACQIDAADYTLRCLLEELSTAMPILQADGSALRALLASVETPVAIADDARAA